MSKLMNCSCFSIDTIIDNCIYKRNAVKDVDCYTPEQLAVLMDGGCVAVDYDENGDPIEWECLSGWEE